MDAPRSPGSRRIVPDTRWRDTLLAVGAGLVVLAFVAYAVVSLGRQANASGGVEGIIAGKEFVPRAETQITIGPGSVQRRQTAGDYVLHVKVSRENGKVYDIYVDPSVYAAERVGDRYYFVRPKD